MDLLKRFSSHLNETRGNGKNYRLHWLRSVLSKGYLPKIQLIGEVEGDGSNEEKAWIAYGKAEGWRLTNGTDGGDGTFGRKFSLSDESRKKISLTQTGRVLSDATCKKMSISHMGRRKSDETRKRMSLAANMRGSISKETRKKMSLARTGRKRSEETNRKLSVAIMGHPGYTKGMKFSDETKLKMSASQKACWIERKKVA